MKKITLLVTIAGLLIITQNSHAQNDSSGIYKTAADFQNKKLSYAINFKTEKHKIKSAMLFNNEEVKVKHQGVNYSLKKSETYGYRDMKGRDFRFVDGKEYRILNSYEPVLIYVYQHQAHSAKDISMGNYKPVYYFSLDAASPVETLTLNKIKAAFPENHKLHDAVDAQFKTDADLYAYDNFHKMYKLNWILKSTNK
ncbi:hypothetical protein A3860_34275 [Niastella vici]|uniref:Uncharacterized protein n=1 Tax=Niastella vici TaxID=1703345 RepID=A0A1V9FP68_9BACT|nr:hypothetical protein [Niastella vici]OQP60149.1 hypothetical protein A3860_34275 [Niastella vici]